MGYWAKDGSYVYDENDTEGIESMIQGQKQKDAPNKQIINKLLNQLPNNCEELKAQLEKVNYRLDLMKPLVEGYRNQFFDVAKQFKDDFSPQASEMVNNKLTEYLCLIETLKTAGYNFGYNDSATQHQFDPYRPEMLIAEVMEMMHLRRKNGANIDIIFPVNYDFTDKEYQSKGDAVTITYNVERHLENNPYVNMFWKKAGYEPEQSNQGRSM